jgi:phage tail sheath gpL-like
VSDIPAIIIAGFGSNDKVPGPVAQVRYGVGGSSVSSATVKCLLVGTQKTSPPSTASTVDTEIFPIRTEQDAIDKAGAGSELHRMARKALKVQGVTLFGICPTPASGPTAASATATFGGSWTTSGQVSVTICGETIGPFGITASATAITSAALLTSLVNANPSLPVTAAQGSSPDDNQVTFTFKSTGVRGNQGIIFRDISAAPSGLTLTLAGGSSVTGGGKFFTSGAGVESLTAMITTISKVWHHRIAWAQNDSTSLAAIKTQIDAFADPLTGKPTHAIVAANGSLSSTISLGQTTLNDPRMQMLWLLNMQSHPSETAAAMAALRAVTEQSNPNSDYDGVALKGIVGAFSPADIASRSTKQSALDNSVTPLDTQPDGSVTVIRSITTLSLVGSNPYYGTLDTYQSYVPDYIGLVLLARWNGWSAVNRYVRDEPSPSEPTPPPNVATPSRWNSEVLAELRKQETANQITNVSTYQPATIFDSTAERLMTRAPVKVLGHQHQMGVSVEQQAVGS